MVDTRKVNRKGRRRSGKDHTGDCGRLEVAKRDFGLGMAFPISGKYKIAGAICLHTRMLSFCSQFKLRNATYLFFLQFLLVYFCEEWENPNSILP